MPDNPQFFSIGEFSRITGISIKTLRFYHEKGLLEPARVDPATDYRSYDSRNIERAWMIARLRELDFPLREIAEILAHCQDESDLLGALRRQQNAVAERMRADRKVSKALVAMIARETEAARLTESGRFDIEEKNVEPILVAALRIKGRYGECGRGFTLVARAMGRHLAGPPLCLYYDGEYREDDADFETCFPLRRQVASPGDIRVRTLRAQRCLCLVHQGPYPQLGRAYRKLLVEAKRRGVALALPSREVYLKGPGAIFRGNPKRYLTEIQLPIE